MNNTPKGPVEARENMRKLFELLPPNIRELPCILQNQIKFLETQCVVYEWFISNKLGVGLVEAEDAAFTALREHLVAERQQAVSTSEEEDTSKRTVIPAHIKYPTLTQPLQFDAVRWFEHAESAEIIAMAAGGFRDSKATFPLVYWYDKAIRQPIVGLCCYVDAQLAMHWLGKNRPDIAPDVNTAYAKWNAEAQ